MIHGPLLIVRSLPHMLYRLLSEYLALGGEPKLASESWVKAERPNGRQLNSNASMLTLKNLLLES